MHLKNLNIRLTVVCMAAASVGLSMALISISKLLILLCCLVFLLAGLRRPLAIQNTGIQATPLAIFLALAALAASLLWTVAPSADALGSLAKYGKLLLIPVFVLLVRSRRDTLFALAAFMVTQLFLVLSSWMLFFHLPVPWATSDMAFKEYAVFSSYLDQGIMGALLAALCWHLRHLAPGRHGKTLATGAAVVAMSNVLFVLSGRSGHVVAIALLSVAIMWELPKKYRALVVVLPFVLAAGLFMSSAKVRDRLVLVKTEVQHYNPQQKADTSSGIRLGLWKDALQMLQEHPMTGTGVGSWSTEFNRLHRQRNPAHVDIAGNGNPHQEYLQWGVQLGIPGILLFLALMLAILRDSMNFDIATARATQSALVALSVACLFNSSLYDALIGDFFCVTLGLLLALGTQQARQHGNTLASSTTALST